MPDFGFHLCASSRIFFPPVRLFNFAFNPVFSSTPTTCLFSFGAILLSDGGRVFAPSKPFDAGLAEPIFSPSYSRLQRLETIVDHSPTGTIPRYPLSGGQYSAFFGASCPLVPDSQSLFSPNTVLFFSLGVSPPLQLFFSSLPPSPGSTFLLAAFYHLIKKLESSGLMKRCSSSVQTCAVFFFSFFPPSPLRIARSEETFPLPPSSFAYQK